MTTQRIVTPLLLTADEVATILRCSERTVRRMAQRGELPSVRSHRRVLIPAKAVDKLIRGAS